MAVRIYTYQLEQAEKYLAEIKNGARIAAMNAINRAMLAAKTKTAQAAAAEYTVKQQDVKEKIKTSRATVGNLEARVVTRGYAIPLIKFPASPKNPMPGKRKPFKSKVHKRGGFKEVKHGFIQKTKKGPLQFLMKVNSSERYPLKVLYGPAIPQMVGSRTVSEAIEKRAEEVLGDRFNHEVARLLRKSLGR